MFRENEDHKQESFFSVENLLPQKMWEKLSNSWAGTFYREVFCRIDETIFAPLYSDKDSRPNVPVNVLVALEILKSGFGWSDEELYEQAKYNLQVRLALGLHNLKEEIFTVQGSKDFLIDFAENLFVKRPCPGIRQLLPQFWGQKTFQAEKG
jgi:hypothetical protein